MDRPVISLSDTKHYRRHNAAFKLALVEQTLQPAASVARIAHEHGVNANQVFAMCRVVSLSTPLTASMISWRGMLQAICPHSSLTHNHHINVNHVLQTTLTSLLTNEPAFVPRN
jgi:hypothetical protein